MDLTEKQKLFVQALSEDGVTPTQAAIRAGYSKRSAAQQANENMKNPKIKKILDLREERRQTRTCVTPEWIMEQTAQIAQSSETGVKDRLRALDMLARMVHMYDPIQKDEQTEIRVVFGDAGDWSI